MTEINESVARKVMETIDAGLCAGVGKPVPGQMCVEAAVCFALGEPFGDEPSCVAPALRALKIRLNDSRWSSNEARAKGMRRLGLAQLGSKGALDEQEFAKRAARVAIQTVVPQALRRAAKRNPKHEQALLDAALLCEREPTRNNALKAKSAATAAYAAYTAADAADKLLSDFAEAIVQVLIEMKAPGCQWLYLTEAA